MSEPLIIDGITGDLIGRPAFTNTYTTTTSPANYTTTYTTNQGYQTSTQNYTQQYATNSGYNVANYGYSGVYTTSYQPSYENVTTTVVN